MVRSWGRIKNKYRAKKVTRDRYTFDSKKEAKRYSELLLLQKAGLISRLQVHPAFQLLNNFGDTYTGETEKGISYIGDFMYVDHKEPVHLVCEDTKGMQTTDFRIKWKWVKYLNPEIEFRIV